MAHNTPESWRKSRLNSKSKSVRGNASTEISDDSATLDKRFLDMKQATAILGVKPQTLYAYVSRGLVRTGSQIGKKTSLYSREDVESVAMRSRKGTPELAIGDRSMRWGAGLILPTSISSIEANGPHYRGRNAIDLARASRNFEDIVELLWTGVLPLESPIWSPPTIPDTFTPFAALLPAIAKLSNSRRLLALIAEAYTASTGKNPEVSLGAPVLAARHLIQVLIPGIGLLRAKPKYEISPNAEMLAAKLARAAGISISKEILDAINICLVLSADNELSSSTFAARVAASAGADIFSCVNSALGAFEGLLTGLGCDQAELLLKNTVSPTVYLASLKAYIKRKDALPGYNHPLYPGLDPRAEFMLDTALSLNGKNPLVRKVLDSVRIAGEELGAKPSLAIGLVAITTALGMPSNSPGVLMAIGRSAGWVAHAFEQRLGGYMVRPRARYVGPSFLQSDHT
jgi:citrate synthase